MLSVRLPQPATVKADVSLTWMIRRRLLSSTTVEHLCLLFTQSIFFVCMHTYVYFWCMHVGVYYRICMCIFISVCVCVSCLRRQVSFIMHKKYILDIWVACKRATSTNCGKYSLYISLVSSYYFFIFFFVFVSFFGRVVANSAYMNVYDWVFRLSICTYKYICKESRAWLACSWQKQPMREISTLNLKRNRKKETRAENNEHEFTFMTYNVVYHM